MPTTTKDKAEPDVIQEPGTLVRSATQVQGLKHLSKELLPPGVCTSRRQDGTHSKVLQHLDMAEPGGVLIYEPNSSSSQKAFLIRVSPP